MCLNWYRRVSQIASASPRPAKPGTLRAPLPSHPPSYPVEVVARAGSVGVNAGGVGVDLLGLVENLPLHHEVADLEHVADALLVEHLLLPSLHATLVHFGLVEVDHLLNGGRAVVAHGGKEEIHRRDVVIVHGIPRRDLRRPPLLHSENLPFGLLNALRQSLVVRLDLGVALVDGGVTLGAVLVRRLGNDLVQNRSYNGGDYEVHDIPNHHLKLHATRREERDGDRVRDDFEWRARDERECDKETQNCVQQGVPLGPLLFLRRELRGQLVDAVLQPYHTVHQVVGGRDPR